MVSTAYTHSFLVQRDHQLEMQNPFKFWQITKHSSETGKVNNARCLLPLLLQMHCITSMHYVKIQTKCALKL